MSVNNRPRFDLFVRHLPSYKGRHSVYSVHTSHYFINERRQGFTFINGEKIT